jgi:hypothetical protein
MYCDPTFAGVCFPHEPQLLTQEDLNDIVRDLNLSKKQAKLLDFMLKSSNLLRQQIKVRSSRGRHKELKDFFS